MRPLNETEVGLLRKILSSSTETAELLGQLDGARATNDSTATFVRLVVDGAGGKHFKDGPVPGRFTVRDSGALVGELLVWVKNGRLSGLEFAWVTDAAPVGMPDPDDVETD